MLLELGYKTSTHYHYHNMYRTRCIVFVYSCIINAHTYNLFTIHTSKLCVPTNMKSRYMQMCDNLDKSTHG